jgi:hypothetical protein
METRSSNACDKTVYLCQVSPNVSCGACCGLYNVADPSPQTLEAMLTRRTNWFAHVPRTVAGIDAFKERVERTEPRKRPFPEFHHCPFLGIIADTGRRVGCLLHPLAQGNEGLDWRGLSYYGGMACRTYFCPSVRNLPDRWLAAIRESMDHWYLHGLIVTERRLLATFFKELENRIGRPIDTADFSRGTDTVLLLRAFAALKLDWPFRRNGAPGVCNYFFEDGLYRRPQAGRTSGIRLDSPFETIFQELDSEFSSTAALRKAEEWIGNVFERIVQPLRNRRRS